MFELAVLPSRVLREISASSTWGLRKRIQNIKHEIVYFCFCLGYKRWLSVTLMG
jgi:hypothetical protein